MAISWPGYYVRLCSPVEAGSMPLFLVRVTTKGHTDVSGTDSHLRSHRCLKAVLLPGDILIYVAMLLPKAIVTYRPMLLLGALSCLWFYHC